MKKKRLKSLEERKRALEELKQEMAERKRLIEEILNAFKPSLYALYKEAELDEDEQLDKDREIEALGECEEWLKELSTRSLREIRQGINKKGVSEHLMDWIWNNCFAEEEEEEEEEEE
jgi:type IV secretory pathway VirB4 component